MNQATPKLRELFERAIELSKPERTAFLNQECTDPAMRSALIKMLAAAEDQSGSLLDRPLDEVIAELGDWDSLAPLVGSSIGPFRLLERLGDGGSSIVYRAERVQAGVSQQVALKLLRRGLHTADQQLRFRDERRALTRLQHPGIARLIEGDITAEGTPYIALELVTGTSIVDHAQSHGLNLRQRLALFTDACRAVEAAHRALIVHRDIKPSNVLVTNEGEVKLLDFGIAKLMLADGDSDEVTEQHVVMTPAYAAPEQFSRGLITTATDVFALGVVLGELITGLRREPGDTRPPSAQLEDSSTEHEHADSLKSLRRKLRGDLDAIVLKATAAEPESRYASAGALAEEIERYLGGHPVVARPSTPLYRAQKFVGRHRGGVVTTSLFLLALVASLGVALWQADVARSEAQRAASVRDFLMRVFSAAEPAGPRLAPPSVIDVVRTSITEAQQSPALYPAVRIELLEALGNVLRTQGEIDDSVQLLESNYREASLMFGPASRTTLLAGFGLARALGDAGKRPEARALYDELLQQQDLRSDPDLRSRLLAASALLAIARYERERAEQESIAALALCNSGKCTEPTRIAAMLARGHVLANFQHDEEAIKVMEEALTAQLAWFAGPHINIAANQQGLSRAYRRLGQFDRAEELARDSLAIVEASVPDPHVRRTDALDTLRQVLIDMRRFDEAEELGLRIIAMDQLTLGPDHPGVATSENTLGFTYMMDAKFAPAIEHYRAALAVSERIPDNHRRSAIYRSNLGVSIGVRGDLEQGMQLVQAAISELWALAEPDHDQICSALEKLGALQRISGDAEASAATYSEAIRIYTDELPDAPKAWRVISLNGLGRALILLGDDTQAAESFKEALAIETTPIDRVSPDRIEARAGLAGILHRQGDEAAALEMFDQVLAERELAQGRLSAGLLTFVDSVAASMAKP